jgi:hypothetical protein
MKKKKKNLKLGFLKGKQWILGLKRGAPSIAGVICPNQILVAKVMTKILSHTRKLPQLGQIRISCQSCADLPAPGNSVPLTCNLTAQHRLT